MRGGAGSPWGCIWGHGEGMLSGRAPTLGSAELSCCSACPLPPASPKPFSCWGRVLFLPPHIFGLGWTGPHELCGSWGQQLRLLCTALSRLPSKWPFPVFVVQDAELYFFPSCPCTLGWDVAPGLLPTNPGSITFPSCVESPRRAASV